MDSQQHFGFGMKIRADKSSGYHVYTNKPDFLTYDYNFEAKNGIILPSLKIKNQRASATM